MTRPSYQDFPAPPNFEGRSTVNQLNEHNMVKNLNWQEVDQLAIYKAWPTIRTRNDREQIHIVAGDNNTSALNHSATLPLKIRFFSFHTFLLKFENDLRKQKVHRPSIFEVCEERFYSVVLIVLHATLFFW